MVFEALRNGRVCAGQLVWRHHVRLPLPSHHVVRTTCMQLLPLMEIYCKWKLKEDCANLRDLILWFDFELELELHELGHSLLFMAWDDDVGLHSLARRVGPSAPANPLDVVKERLAVAGLAVRDSHPQVQLVIGFSPMCKLAKMFVMVLNMTFVLFCR